MGWFKRLFSQKARDEYEHKLEMDRLKQRQRELSAQAEIEEMYAQKQRKNMEELRTAIDEYREEQRKQARKERGNVVKVVESSHKSPGDDKEQR